MEQGIEQHKKNKKNIYCKYYNETHFSEWMLKLTYKGGLTYYICFLFFCINSAMCLIYWELFMLSMGSTLRTYWANSRIFKTFYTTKIFCVSLFCLCKIYCHKMVRSIIKCNLIKILINLTKRGTLLKE